jgi:NAD(P)-dependent dehydrogenase (short-subunit alcohol dehydrogenase family)
MAKPLENKLALVTGSSRGIGAAIAIRLATVTAGPRRSHLLRRSSPTLSQLLSTAKILRLTEDGTPNA